MNTDLLFYIKKYKEMIILEQYEHIRKEMIIDLKHILLNESVDIDINYSILETFYDINDNNVIDRLEGLENLLEGSEISISNIKSSFNSKYDKIVQRDKQWLKTNKKKLLGLNYGDAELEILNDYKVTMEQLLNRHSTFEKAFTNQDVNLIKFKDKRDDLKNGLDNYFRSGASYREVGLKRVKGEEAKLAVESMVSYCETFLNDKKPIEDKINAVIVAVSDSSVKESLSPIETLRALLEADDALKDIENTSKELSKMNNTKKVEEKPENKKSEKVDVTEPEKEEKNNKPEKVDVTKDEKSTKEEVPEEEPETAEEEIPEETEGENNTSDNGLGDRQIGIAVLLSVIEARYFDYIKILKELTQE